MKRNFFTLHELLIAGISAVLLGTLALSALNADTPAGAEAAVCANQQKNIFAALTAYAGENNGFLPYWDDEYSIPGCKTRVTWAYRISKYLPAESGNRNYFCPSQQAMYPADGNRSRMDDPASCFSLPDKRLESYRFINYGINHEYAASNVGRWAGADPKAYVTAKFAQVVNPADKVLTADASNGTYGRYVITHYSSGSNKMAPCHSNSANVLWFDGHVAAVKDPHKTLQNGKNVNKHFRIDK